MSNVIFHLFLEEEQSVPTPRDKLREALSSRESFQRIYLVSTI